jgi:hypothetical protein
LLKPVATINVTLLRAITLAVAATARTARGGFYNGTPLRAVLSLLRRPARATAVRQGMVRNWTPSSRRAQKHCMSVVVATVVVGLVAADVYAYWSRRPLA